MRITQFISAIVTISLTCCVTQSMAAPPNDNYADRITLTGTDITFTGTLADATREEDPFEIVPEFLFGEVNQTVWWEWTPTQSTAVVIQIIGRPSVSERQSAVQVYNLQNIYTGSYIAVTPIETRVAYNFLTFQAEAGTNYQIQLAGSDSATITMRLLATNAPFIIEHPKSQTVSTDDSVMFGVIVAAQWECSYQWQRMARISRVKLRLSWASIMLPPIRRGHIGSSCPTLLAFRSASRLNWSSRLQTCNLC